MNKPGVMIYFTMRPSRKLPMEDRLRLYDAMLDYGETGVVPDFGDGPLAVLWDYFQPKLDTDNQRYESIRAKRSQAGRLGGLASQGSRQPEQEPQDGQEEASEAKEAKEATEANTIQSSTVQSSSITGEYSGQSPSRPQEGVCPPYPGRDRGLCPGGKACHGPSGICGLLHRQRLEDRQPHHEGLACRRPELGPEGGPYAPAAPSARPHCPSPIGGPL